MMPARGRTSRLFHSLPVFLRIAFGVIFLFSGGMKIIDLARFSESLTATQIVPARFISSVSVAIPVAEVIIGAAIVLGFRTAIMSAVAAGLLALFTGVIAEKVIEGADVSCGCFGSLSSEKITETTVIRNFILLLWGAILFAYYSTAPRRSQVQGSPLQANNNESVPSLENLPTTRSGSLFWKHLQKAIGIAAILFLLTEVALLSVQNRELKSRLAMLVGREILEPGETVPPFKARDVNGKEIEIAYDQGSLNTMLFVLSTTCNPCKENLPNWSEIVRKLDRRRYRILGISLSSRDLTGKYVLEHGLSYPVLVPSDETFSREYKASTTPQTILVDAAGRVEKVWRSVLDSLQMEELLTRLGPGDLE
jgi:putative oxidoreductase